MKKFTINCDFGGQMSPFTIYVGTPEQGHHPLHFQADWLSKQRGGMIPGEVMEAVSQLQELAKKNGVSLEELCVYALGTQEEQDALTTKKEGTDQGEGNETTGESTSDENYLEADEGARESVMEEKELKAIEAEIKKKVKKPSKKKKPKP